MIVTDQRAAKAIIRRRLEEVRERTLWLMDRVSDDFLRRRVHDFYSPIGWHFGHVGRTEEYWVIMEALGQEPLDPHLTFLLADLPDNPKDNRVTIPDRDGLKAYMASTRARVLEALEAVDLDSPDRLLRNGYGWDFAIQHECQHQETIAEMLSLIAQKQSDPEFPEPVVWRSSLKTEWRALPGGTFAMGSDDPFGYDNEKRAHAMEVASFKLSRFPVTAFQWTEFVTDGGYRNPKLWSEQGWAWKCQEEAEIPEYWVERDGAYFAYSPVGLRALHPDEPASCLSWFEAEAFTKWSGTRMPTEPEWEFASRGAEGRTYPWGQETPDAKLASFWLNGWGPDPVDAHPKGATEDGVEGLGGGVWEWTSTPFLPYPGFDAYPYDGYSKDHMKGAHRVCRGGSWATSAPILRSSFRNWYVPTYRQGFLGLRLAND